MSGQLDPEVSFLLVGLKEGRPLDDAAQLTPAGRLKHAHKLQLAQKGCLEIIGGLNKTLTGVAGAEAEGGSAASESHSELRSSLEASP